MANDKDKLFEKIYFLWKGEGEKRNQSIDWFCERYGANVEEYHKWFKGINKAVKEIQVVGRPGEPVQPKLTAAPSDPTVEEAMENLREKQEQERIIITTSDAGKKPNAAIATLTITCGNGLHITRKGMSYDEFIQLAQNLKALC